MIYNKKIFSDIKANFTGAIVPIASAIICIPCYVLFFSDSVAVMIFQLIAAQSLFLILDFGISKSSIFYISKSIGQSNIKIAIKYTNEAIALSITISILAFIILYLLLDQSRFNWNIFNKENSIFLSFLLSLSILINTIRSIFEGWGKFITSNTFRAISNSSIYISPLLTIFHSNEPDVVLYLFSFVTLSKVLILFIGIFLLFKNLNFDQYKLRFVINLNILRFSLVTSISSLLLALMLYLDRFIVDEYFSKVDSVIYMSIQEFMLRLLVISGSFASVLYHHFSMSYGEYGDVKILNFYYQKVRLNLIKGNLICVLFILFFYMLVKLNQYLFPNFIVENIDIIVVMLFGTSAMSFSIFSQTILISTFKIKSLLASHILQLILFTLLINQFYKFGILGASILWSIRAILDYVTNELIIYFYIRNLNER